MNFLKKIKEKFSKKVKEVIEDNSSYNPNIGNLAIRGNQAFVDGREIELDRTSNIHLTQKNGKVLLNGKPLVYKDKS